MKIYVSHYLCNTIVDVFIQLVIGVTFLADMFPFFVHLCD